MILFEKGEIVVVNAIFPSCLVNSLGDTTGAGSRDGGHVIAPCDVTSRKRNGRLLRKSV